MHVAHVIAGLVFAQAVEVEVVVDDFAAWLTFQIAWNAGVQGAEQHGLRMNEHVDLVHEFLFVADQTERVAFADG